MKKKMYDTLSLRGGASRGLVYFKLLKEIYKKNITFKKISGASAGGIFGACLACVRHPERIYKLFKDLEGDKIMKWACEAEKGETHAGKKLSIDRRLIRGLGLLTFKCIPYNSIKKTFKKHLSWDRLKDNGVEFLAIGVVKQKDVMDILGKQFFNELKKDGFKDLLDNDGLDDVKTPSMNLIHKIPMYFFTNKGTYKKVYGRDAVLIDERVQPLWKVVLATFANPILPKVRLRFEKGKAKKVCFDGGIANNYANTIWNTNKFCQASCFDIPKKVDGKELGLAGINTLYYNENRGLQEKIIKSKVKFKGFFGFYDGNVDDYYKEASTNFFV